MKKMVPSPSVVFRLYVAVVGVLLLPSCRRSGRVNALGFPQNVSSYLNFHIPNSLRKNESYVHRTAMFGNHYALWGEEGSLVLPVKFALGYMDLCTVPSHEEVREKWNLPKDYGPFMLLVHRDQKCSFVEKVRHAQQLGASAVIVADPVNNHLPHTMANDGSGQDVSIPSVLVGKETYEDLKKVYEQHNHTGTIVAELGWHPPRFTDRVVLDLWHSPIDTHTKDFLTNFSVLAATFELSHQVDLLEFHEHPILLDGSELGCVGHDVTPDDPCYHLCTNGGRYCHVSHRHTNGKDVVIEALRRLCVAKHFPDPAAYWSYVTHFSSYCWDSDYYANDECVKDAFHHSGINYDDIETCMQDSGAHDSDQENALLQSVLQEQHEQGIVLSPTVLVNHDRATLWGGLTSKSVLEALCGTFVYGEKPHVCYVCAGCGDPVACAGRTPMKCLEGDGQEKEDPNAHRLPDDHGSGRGTEKRTSHVGRWLFGIVLVGGCAGAFVYYKKHMEGEDGLGSYSLQDAFLSDRT
jgi:hypothetical protein